MIDKYIKGILSEHGKVYIPNLGLIYKELETNGNPFDPSILKKPVYIYKIDTEYYNDDDTWLVYAVARGNHITIEEAETQIRQRVDEIKMLLNEGRQVQIDNLGTLFLNEGRINISHSVITEESESFGIPKEIYLAPEETPEVIVPSEQEDVHEEQIQIHEEPPVVYSEPERVESSAPEEFKIKEVVTEERNDFFNEHHYDSEEKERKSKTGLIAAIIVFLLIGFGLTYFFFLKPSSEDNDIAVNTPVDDVEVYDSAQFATPSSEVESFSENKPLSVKEEGKRYYIIAGSFTINENAQKFKRKLDSRGLKATVIESKESQNTFRVSLADFEELQDAVAKSESLKKKYGNSIWILKY